MLPSLHACVYVSATLCRFLIVQEKGLSETYVQEARVVIVGAVADDSCKHMPIVSSACVTALIHTSTNTHKHLNFNK
jgi:hypothetical protein